MICNVNIDDSEIVLSIDQLADIMVNFRRSALSLGARVGTRKERSCARLDASAVVRRWHRQKNEAQDTIIMMNIKDL